MHKDMCEPCMHRKMMQEEASEAQSLHIGLMSKLVCFWERLKIYYGQVRWVDQSPVSVLCPLRIAKFHPRGKYSYCFLIASIRQEI